jgi:exonuclease VII small subunit
MRKSLSLLLIPAIALGGCQIFGGRTTPDEFAVARNAPLIIPPDYTLTPPASGTATTTPQDAQRQAIDVLFGGPAERPEAETSLLDAAGRDQRGARRPVGRRRHRHHRRRHGSDDPGDPRRPAERQRDRVRSDSLSSAGGWPHMAEETLSTRLVEIESMLERSRRRFEEGSRLVEEAHQALAEIQQALIGSPGRISQQESDEAASRLVTSLRRRAARCPRACAEAGCRSTRCRG